MAEDHGAPEAGHFPGPGPKVERQNVTKKANAAKKFVARQCRMRCEVSWVR